ncbi:MAG: hypothetical protein HOJ95_17275 [Nitrospinaceae bacterium]|jgi:hypothetical protein|nr:hypothetical protein [Nitrospinaceae bacterium]MBT3432610.1 hypothetical protein [Nitrospinaceae bacterium]MBT3819888.1 hypothetical protein [Nitrospinaceae bacterium]MBT5366795.1 hypothetical protein [Nitrospinaceae bacterium]MBT5948426.1 hypothetical protein [Nitrospinaceae bacterium]
MGDTLLMDRQSMGATEEQEETADSATSTTLVDAALTEADDHWNGSIIRTIRGTGVGQRRTVSDFDAVSDTMTVSASWDTNPDSGSVYLIDRPAPAAELFRGGNLSHDLNVEQLQRAVKDASLSPFPFVSGKRSAQLSFTTELRGSGTAGTAPDYGVLFRACGMKETLVGGTSVTYDPTSDKTEYVRTCITAYIDGLRIMYLGCMGTFSINAPLDGVPTVDWDFQAADFEVSDAAIVEGTAYDSQIPEPVLVAGFSFAGFNFDATSVSFAMNNEVTLRQSANTSGGHINGLLTGRAPSGSFDPEAVLKATEDVFADWEAGTQVALSIQIGQSAGNICTITAPKCQYTDVGLGDRDGMLTYDAPFSMARNAGNDEIKIAFT